MKISRAFRGAAIAVIVAATLGISIIKVSAHFDYRFKVHNKTKTRITKILVSEDKKKWGQFDVGDGIAAGATDELVWDKSTDNGGCEWWLKAVYADGSDSEPAKFDFCEKDLVVEFED